MSTSFRCHFGFMDNMSQFDDIMAELNMKVKSFPNIGPVPFQIHGEGSHVFYMADDALTYGDLEKAYNFWLDAEEPDEWVEVTRA